MQGLWERVDFVCRQHIEMYREGKGQVLKLLEGPRVNQFFTYRYMDLVGPQRSEGQGFFSSRRELRQERAISENLRSGRNTRSLVMTRIFNS